MVMLSLPLSKEGRKGSRRMASRSSPGDKPLNFVNSCGVPVIHRDLLSLIDDEIVKRDLYIGRVLNEQGNEVRDWCTARGRHQIIVRGSKEAGSRTCEECDRTLYCAMGKRSLFPAPPSDAAIFESDFLGFVVTRNIADRITTRKWRRMYVEPLPVPDEPPDGLGVLSVW
jgi:hypothetical protein